MSTVALWALTYALHSTLLLGAAAIACAVLGRRRLGVQELILRVALLAPLATAAVQVVWPVEPWAGRVAIAPAITSRSTTTHVAPIPDDSTYVPDSAPMAPAPRTPRASTWTVVGILLVAWAATASLGFVRLLVAALRLRRLERADQPVGPGAMLAVAETIAARVGVAPPVRLRTTEQVDTPFATGILRPRVVLPGRVLRDLGVDEQAALCAHELAHLARRDPAWLLLARGITAALPFQPLNFWARHRLEQAAECLSDDLAASAMGDGLGLARSLVHVASWSAHPSLLPAAGALTRRSRLRHRVERLMDPFRSLETTNRLLWPLLAVAVVGVAVLAPAVAAGTPPSPPTAPAAPSAVAAPAAPAPPAPWVGSGSVHMAVPPVPPVPPLPAHLGQDLSDLERQLEQLGERLSARMEGHTAEMEKLQDEIERSVHAEVSEEAMRSVSEDMSRAAEEMAAAVADRAQGREDAQARLDAAHARMAAARDRMRRDLDRSRPDRERMREMSDRLRDLVEQAGPTREEQAELRRLTREIARSSVPSSEEIRRITREAMLQAREAMRQASAEMRRGHDEERRARDEERRARDIQREAEREQRRLEQTPPAQP